MLHSLASIAALLAVANADCYLHNPKGSNDRLNEQSAARDNENRLFDSQNNNRGGYNVGDLDPVNGFTATDWMASATEMYDFRFLYTAGQLQKQYEMLYFEQSQISVTWTNQHAAGNAKVNSAIILQFICDTFPRATSAGTDGTYGPGNSLSGWSNGAVGETLAAQLRQHGLRVELYNGGNTNTPNAPTLTASSITSTYSSNNANDNGRRESEEYYALCNARNRNNGLFTADQQLQGSTQIYSRQNPAGTRYGLECQEERDYYPWWNPSPFHDIAIITPDVAWCNSTIAPQSQNVVKKYQCVYTNVDGTTAISTWLPTTSIAEENLNETNCNALSSSGFSWQGISWNARRPACIESYYSRDNHLGNTDGSLRGGKMAGYDWILPTVSNLNSQHYCYVYSYSITGSQTPVSHADNTSPTINCVRMMLRIRYNISTMDYDPHNTDYRMNQNNDEGVISPIQEDPTVDVGVLAQGLQLAINTAQTGRTFQDTTHTFLVCEQPSDAPWKGQTILNINVRGKRGNIVETFPAIEFDFEPQMVFVVPGQCMHFQWDGSNTHNNGDPGGDGQTGDAGQGREGSDRSNLVQIRAMDESYPITYDKTSPTFFDSVTCHHPLFGGTTMSSQDCQLVLGSGGFYRMVADVASYITTYGSSGVLDYLMDNVSGAFRQGVMVCVNSNALSSQSATLPFSFVSTRNNAFTNRSQKLNMLVTYSPEDGSLW